ncbi:MAG: Ig-like domain-containing protein, partial [Gemmatimonadales bacterium]
GGAARHLFTPSNSVYLSYWVKYSPNWVGSGAIYHPHEFLFLTTEDGAYVGPSSTHLTTYVEHNYQNGGIPVLDMQDGSNIDQSKIGVDLTRTTENRAANGCNGTLDGMGSCYLGPAGIYQNEKRMEASAPTFLPNPGTGYKGDWHFVEAYFQLNSIQSGKGVADGIAQYWFDGQLVINQTHLLMRTGVHATMQFNQFMIAPYIGDGSPVDQTMWVDDVTLATARVGSAPPPPTVATVTVTPTSATAVAGTTYQFGATPADASGNPLTGEAVTWSSSNTAVATVSTSGQATAVAAGSATIRATSNGVTGTAALTVTAAAPAPVATVTLSPATLSQAPGATAQLTATLKDAQGNLLTGRSVSWSSTKSAVATVSPSGLESAVAAGSATIKATSEGKSATATVTVTNTTAKPGTVANLTVAGSTDTSLTLSFTQVSDGTGKPASYDVRVGTAASFSWGGASSVTQGSCATPLAGTAVGAKLTCTVTGLTSGTAYDVQLVAYRGTLGGATFGGLSNVGSGTTTTPTASVGSVTVTPGSASGSVGQAAQFTATVRDLNGNVLSGRTVTWSSTNSAVVTVTATGYATAVGAGTAQLVATTGGKTGSAAITVTR